MNKIEYNIIDNTGRLSLKNNWYINIGDQYYNGYRIIRTTKGWNYIDKDGNILSDEYYSLVCVFRNGFGMVRNKEDKWNYLKTDGTYLSSKWFDFVGAFKDGFAEVRNKREKIKYLDIKGNLYNKRY